MSSKPSKTPPPIPVPKWETAIIFISFLVLWAWWLASQAAQRAQTSPSPFWYLALLTAVAALIAVFVRRVRRTAAAMKATGAFEKRKR